MNDFTKRELKIIMMWFDIAESAQLISRIYEFHELEKKIFSMIDNYCEHESLFSMGENKHCCKCGEWFNDNQ